MFDYDNFFSNSPLNIHDQPERHQTVEKLCRGVVLDIGCGTGSLSEYYKGEYIGFDISKVAIEKAKEGRRKDANFYVKNHNQVTSSDIIQADTIVLAEFLEHIEDDKRLFDVIKKHSREGTRLIVSVPNGERVPSPDHVREFTPKELKDKLAPYGDVRLINWVGVRSRIIATVELKKKQRNIISLSIMAKDEEKGIEECIISAMEYTDKIIIQIDDSTSDQTEKIASRYADKIIKYTWKNDFSAARNNLLNHVNTPWVLFLDGHEYLVSPPKIEGLRKSDSEARMCQIELESGSIVRYPRLHRNSVRYKDAVHNQLNTKKVSNDSDILIKHDRANNQTKRSTEARERQRDKMITDIMGASLRKNKKDTRALMHSGLHSHAKKDYKKAIKFYRRYLKYGTNQGERWYVTFNLVMCYLGMRSLWRAEHTALKLEIESPNRWENKLILGEIYKIQKQYEKAIIYIVDSFEEKRHEADYKPIKRDISHNWNDIGECYFRLNKYTEASQAFRMAAKHNKIDEFKTFLYARAKLMEKMAIAVEKQK